MEKFGTSCNCRRRYNGSFIGAHCAFTKVDENQNQKMSTYQKGSTHQKGEETDDGDGNFNDPGEAYDDEPGAKLPRPPVKNAHYNGSMSGALMDDTHIFSAIASSSGEDEAGAEAGVEVAAAALN